MASGDSVNIAGVPVGQVSSIGVQHGHALIVLSINNTVSLPRSTDVGMRWHNVIGQKEIELFPGRGGPILSPGSTIPLTHDVTDASIDTFLNSLGPLLSSINPKEANEFVENVSGALEGDTAQINQLINSGATVSSTVQALDSQVGQIIGNLNQVLTALASRSGDIDSLVTNLQTVSSALASKNSLLDGVVGNLSLVATDLAGLIGNNHSTITSTINNLQTRGGRRAEQPAEFGEQPVQLSGRDWRPYIQISQWGQWFAVRPSTRAWPASRSVPTISPAIRPQVPAPREPSAGGPLSGATTPAACERLRSSASSNATSRVGLAAARWLRRASAQNLQAVSGATTGASK